MGVATKFNKQLSDALVVCGAHLPRQVWVRLESVARRTQVERFLRDAAGGPGERVASRFDVYAIAAGLVAGEAVTYLEFGVHTGQSMRFFARELAHPDTRLHGFDSFEGLPEDWTDDNPRGTFATGGTPPAIDDDRVTFHVGWFDQTLPGFQLDRVGRVLVNIDCDLYSSTVTLLDAIGPQLRPGDLLYFDEFADLEHEFRAFRQHLVRSGLGVETVARSGTWNNVLFRVRA